MNIGPQIVRGGVYEKAADAASLAQVSLLTGGKQGMKQGAGIEAPSLQREAMRFKQTLSSMEKVW